MTTTKLIDTTTDVTSDTLIPPRNRDEKGLWQAEIAAAGPTLSLQGRAAPDAPWHIIVSEAAAQMGDNDTNVTTVDMFPEMRAVVTGNTSTVVKGWLVD
jgi:hypothetical protein